MLDDGGGNRWVKNAFGQRHEILRTSSQKMAAHRKPFCLLQKLYGPLQYKAGHADVLKSRLLSDIRALRRIVRFMGLACDQTYSSTYTY